MSTEPSENDCSDKTPVLRNDFLMTSVQTTGEDWAIAGPSNAFPRSPEPAFCPVHSPYAWSASSTRGERSTTSFDSAEIALVTDSKSNSDESNRWVTIVDDPQNLPPTNELSAPPAYEDVFNRIGQQMSPTEECAEAYWEFAKIVRNSLYYNVFFDVLLLTISISALLLGMLFINECILYFELILMVLLMGLNGLMCSLSRMAPLVFSKFGMVGSEWIFETSAVIFFTLFTLIGIVEIVLMASFAKYVLCLTFVHYMVYVNFGYFLLGILTFSLYVEVLTDALMTLNPNSLLRWMRMLCTC